jgi:DNA ligase 4
MGFRFSYLCDLLSSLEANRTLKACRATNNSKNDLGVRTISNWFGVHQSRIHHDDTDLLALVSCLFPSRRPDRVYWLQHASLAKIIARSLLLGVSRKTELDRWQMSGDQDLGQRVESVLQQSENQINHDQTVTVEEIDDALNQVASRCRYSGARIRMQRSAVDVNDILGSLYRRVSSRDAKWLTRMILKSYHPVILPADFILEKIHFLLPPLLLFQDSFEAVTRLLTTPPFKLFPITPEPEVATIMKAKALEYLTPQVGVKSSHPDFLKARSIQHCCRMIGQRRMSLERKYDGEYYQIHFNLGDASQSLQIFSKSGKESTLDRASLQPTLRRCLRVGEPACKFVRHCILEGEMVV